VSGAASPSASPAAASAPAAETLAARLLEGDPAALARAITAVENWSAAAPAVLRAIQPRLGRALVLGVTGAPGAGKSTLLDALIGEWRGRGRTVGVIAVDPSSPLTGGAILGDRIRMSRHAGDAGVFVRSLASRGAAGALPPAAARVVDLMDAAGREVVILETVGAGQSEVEVADVADTRVVVATPGTGDDVQAIKAGVLEIADLLVVNKSDLPGADRTASQLREMLSLRARVDREVPVLATTATTAAGVPALVDAVESHREWLAGAGERTDPRARIRRLLAAAAGHIVRERIRTLGHPRLDALCAAVQAGEMDPVSAAARLLEEVPGPTADGRKRRADDG